MQEQSRFTYSIFPYTPESEFFLSTSRYSFNNRVALQMYKYDSEFDYYEPFATLTINLINCHNTKPNCVFIDTNNCPWALNLLCDKLKVAKLTQHVGQSGFCYYPEVEINPFELSKYIPYIGEDIND